MGADFSRIRSNPLLDFAGVELKQGAVVLDADVNELVAAVDRRLRALASDVLGRHTVSQTTPNAFKLSAVAGSLSIAKGRLYVDGLLAENHGARSTDAAKLLLDPLMAEPVYADAIDYAAQPYLPSPPPLPTAGRHLVYLDVWQREVTHLENPDLVEIALGVETSSRVQTVWQVRVLGDDAGNASCGSDDADFAGWSTLTAASTGRLTTGTFSPPPSPDPCELPPSGDYQGLENQTYRVEIHDAGQPGGTATFKWSRENASVGSRVASVISATELQLQTLGRDDVLRLNTGDWVEIIDDAREFSQAPGEMRNITVNEAAQRITFNPPLPASMRPTSFPDAVFPKDRNLRVRKWDQQGKVLRAETDTPVFQTLDATGPGVIAVPAAGHALLLENGVTVSFASTGAKGFRAGDFWVFAARTADASVEKLVNAPPRGVHHHHARLGIWTVGAGDPSDCRTPWPPLTEGHDCSCTECVTPESHASGALTIQAAVDRIRDTGGTVCLGVGQYALQEPVHLNNARSVRIRGQGSATVVVTPGGAFAVNRSIGIAIEDMTILSVGNSAAAIAVHTALGLTLQRLVIAVLAGDKTGGVAIALTGLVIGATVRDNTVFGPAAVTAIDPGATATGTNQAPRQVLAAALLRIEGNLMWCERAGITFGPRVLHLLSSSIAGNEWIGCRQVAMAALGLGLPGSSMSIARNNAWVSGPAIAVGVQGLLIEANHLTAAGQAGNTTPDGPAITLRTGLDPNGIERCQVLANQIDGFSGAGVSIEAPVRDLIVKLNLVQRCGNGIVSGAEAESAAVAIENNQVSDIGSDEGQTGEVLGIGITRAAAASVVGNTVQRVGTKATLAALKAGIVASSIARLKVSGNTVAGVAPPGEYGGRGAGIALLAPLPQAQVDGNIVDRDETPNFQSNKAAWTALLVDQPGDQRFVARLGHYAAVRIDAKRTLVFGARRPYLVASLAADTEAGAARTGGIGVLGNAFAGRSADPVVDVSVGADCLFNDNRVEQRGGGGALTVSLASRTCIVNANRVQGSEVSVLVQADPKLITVLGNITGGKIVTGGASSQTWAPLGAPWEALNVRG